MGLPQNEAAPLEPYPSDVVSKLRQMDPAVTEAEPFAEAEPILSEVEARREGSRCLGCLAGAEIDDNKCASCLTCLRVCPLDAIEIGEAMRADPVRCQACGLCASICPANAVTLSFWGAGSLTEQLSSAAEDGGVTKRVLALVCEHRTDDDGTADIVLRVPCLARLKPADVLHLFLQGCESLVLHTCQEDQCKYGSAWRNIESMAQYVRGILDATRPGARIEVRVPGDADSTTHAPAGEVI